jgi:SAM-dependent methyltransferase
LKRHVVGGDVCLNSLRLANGFRERYRIANAAFLQMNIFRPPFRDGSIDVVICSRVLHHTRDARAGFEALLRKIKPGGLILIELYNCYARLPALWRRWAFEQFGSTLYFLDPRLTSARMNEGRWRHGFATSTATPMKPGIRSMRCSAGLIHPQWTSIVRSSRRWEPVHEYHAVVRVAFPRNHYSARGNPIANAANRRSR